MQARPAELEDFPFLLGAQYAAHAVILAILPHAEHLTSGTFLDTVGPPDVVFADPGLEIFHLFLRKTGHVADKEIFPLTVALVVGFRIDIRTQESVVAIGENAETVAGH